MPALAVMGGRVTAGGVVAAADVAARLAHPKVNPAGAFGQALLTTGDGLRELEVLDRVEVGADSHERIVPAAGPVPAQNLHANRPPPPQLPGTLGGVSAPLICVVEDEQVIATAVAARLRADGFSVEVAHDGHAGVELCRRVRPDLVVLDVMLPGLDGLEVCRRVQQDRPVPVLMLTARSEETDVLVGLGVGADDYMTKPFSPRELVARVRALLRRVERRPAPHGDTRRVGAVELDPAARRVTVAGQLVHLTPTEFDLLALLAARPGVVYTREQLLADVWGWRDGSGHRTVDSHVRGLRRKLGAERVRTVHGVGYALEV